MARARVQEVPTASPRGCGQTQRVGAFHGTGIATFMCHRVSPLLGLGLGTARGMQGLRCPCCVLGVDGSPVPPPVTARWCHRNGALRWKPMRKFGRWRLPMTPKSPLVPDVSPHWGQGGKALACLFFYPFFICMESNNKSYLCWAWHGGGAASCRVPAEGAECAPERPQRPWPQKAPGNDACKKKRKAQR